MRTYDEPLDNRAGEGNTVVTLLITWGLAAFFFAGLGLLAAEQSEGAAVQADWAATQAPVVGADSAVLLGVGHLAD